MLARLTPRLLARTPTPRARTSTPARAGPPSSQPSTPKNGGDGEKHRGGRPSPTKAAADQPPSATTVGGVHPDTTLEFYASPVEAATPYLKDVMATERAPGGRRGPAASHPRLARTHFSPAAEAAVNEQIGREWALAYHYEALASLFAEGDRALPGVAAHFRAEADGERRDARAFQGLQASRGGSTRLPALAAPEDFLKDAGGDLLTGGLAPARPGDVTRAFEAALALEAMNFSALEGLHGVAEAEGDPQMQDFVEGMLARSSAEVKAAADYVSQLARVGPGLGEWLFDRELARGRLAVFEEEEEG